MKNILAWLILLFSTFSVYGQEFASIDSVNILSVIEDWNKGWQTKNHELASRGYSLNARFTNAFGDKRNGRGEIRALLKEVFALPFVMAGNSETTEHRYQPLNNVIVVVHTSVIRKGQQMPDGLCFQTGKRRICEFFRRREKAG